MESDGISLGRIQFKIIAHTHWDREWYLPFERFRARLIELIDRVAEILETRPDYKSFHLDGQTIALEDYEEIRGRSQKLRDLIGSGRIKVGPWHVLPDEFLVSGEALIRNLLRGRKLCLEFGAAPLAVGYLPDMFGHVAQAPQLLAGFGMKTAVVWRGVPATVTEQKFVWTAPDGTSALAAYLPVGYGAGAGLPRDPALLVERLEALVAEVGVGDDGRFLLLVGSDHVEPDLEVLETFAAAARLRPGWSFEFSDWEEWMTGLAATAPPRALVRGELRSAEQTLILPGVASARLYLKKLDFLASAALEREAEPLAALARAHGHADFSDQIDYAWRLLLQNHPHDSICGCSVDAVHDEMETRFAKVREVADRVAGLCLGRLAAGLDGGGNAAPRATLVVYNPAGAQAPAVISGTIEGSLKRDAAIKAGDGEPWPVQVLETLAPEKVLMDARIPRPVALIVLRDVISREPYGLQLQRIEQKKAGDALELRIELGTSPSTVDLEAQRLSAERALKDPAIAWVHAKIVRLARRRVAAALPSLPGHSLSAFELVSRKSPGPAAVATGPDWIENGLIKLKFEPDGTCLITDQRTGLEYRALHFLDVADRGDSYNFDPLPEDETICEVERVAAKPLSVGPVAAAFELRHRLRPPESLRPDRQGRSKKPALLDLRTVVTVYQDSPRVDFRTRFTNAARDHRLQVAFRAPFEADAIRVETPFALVDRPIVANRPPGPEQRRGLAYQLLGAEGTYAASTHKSLAIVGRGGQGLAIMNRGMAEVEALRLEGATRVALTLVRAVGWLSRGDLNLRKGDAGPMLEAPGAQCRREFEWDYAVAPWADDEDGALALAAAHGFAYPPRLFQARLPGAGRRALELIGVDNPRVYLSSLRPLSDGAVEARLVNASRRPQRCEASWRSWRGEAFTDLKGDVVELENATMGERSMRAELRPFQILTFRLGPERTETESGLDRPRGR